MLDNLNHGYGFEQQQSYAMQDEDWEPEDEYHKVHGYHSSMKIMPTPCLDSHLSKNRMMVNRSQTTLLEDGNWQGQRMNHQDSWQPQEVNQDGFYGQKVHKNGWQGQEMTHQNGRQGSNSHYSHASGGKLMPPNGNNPSHLFQNGWQGQEMMHQKGWQGSNSNYNPASGGKLMPPNGNNPPHLSQNGSNMFNDKTMGTEFENFHNVHAPAPPTIMKVKPMKYKQNKWSNEELNCNNFGESPNCERYGGYQKAEWISKGL